MLRSVSHFSKLPHLTLPQYVPVEPAANRIEQLLFPVKAPGYYSQFLLPKGELSAPEFPSKLGDAQLRPLHRFGQHLPPMALHSLSCRHLGVQFVTLVDEGQSAKRK